MKVVFFATPDIALNTFKFLIQSKDYELLALVTQKAKPCNRGKKIVERNITSCAKEHDILVLEPDRISKDVEVIEKLKSLKPDFFVTFAFGQILSQEVIDIPKYATINIHASLLPKYRGSNPIVEAIKNGDKITGLTTMKTVLELDKGDICLSEEIEIPSNMNVIELMEKMSLIAPKLLDDTLKGLYEGTIEPMCQDENLATYTKKTTKEEKLIDFNLDAIVLHNKIRSMYMINTNHTFFNNKIIKVLQTQIVDYNEGNIGEIVEIQNDGIVVKCKNNAIKLITLKPEGKSQMRAIDWARGQRIEKGQYFG